MINAGYFVEHHGECADRRAAIKATETAPFDRAEGDRVFFDGQEVGFCGSGCGLLHPDGTCGPCYGAETSRCRAAEMRTTSHKNSVFVLR